MVKKWKKKIFFSTKNEENEVPWKKNEKKWKNKKRGVDSLCIVVGKV